MIKNTTFFAAALIGVSALSGSAFAQDKPLVPGSDTSETAVQTQSRDSVQKGTAGAETPPPASPTAETILPGSDAGIDKNEAKTRDAVAAGTDAETTGPDGSTAGTDTSNPTGSGDDSGSTATQSPMETQSATPK